MAGCRRTEKIGTKERERFRYFLTPLTIWTAAGRYGQTAHRVIVRVN